MNPTARPTTSVPHHPALIATVVAVGAVIGAALYAGAGAAAIFYYVLVDGGLCVLWLAAAAGWGAWPAAVLLRTRERSPSFDSLVCVTTSIALGLGLLGLVVLGVGLAGGLNQPIAIALLVTGLCAGGTCLHSGTHLFRGGPQDQVLPATAMNATDDASNVDHSAWRWLWLLAAPALACVIVAAAVPPGMLWKPEEPHGFDAVAYHLQAPREWLEAGRIVPLQHNVFSYFPFGVEVHYLLAFHVKGGAWQGMYLAQLMHAAFTALAVAAVYAFGRRLSGRRSVATLAAVAFASTPWLAQLAPIAFNEGGLLLYVALSAGWAMEAMRRPNAEPGDTPASPARLWVLAGLMAGFGAGVKLTGVPLMLLGVPAAAVVAIACQRGWRSGWHGLWYSTARAKRSKADDATHGQASTPVHATPGRTLVIGPVLFVIAGVLAMSPWLIRNAAWCGNPVFPQATGLFGKAHFTDAQVERWNRAHAARPDQQSLTGRLAAFGDQVYTNWQFGYVLLPIGVLALAVGWRRPESWFLALLLLVHLVVWLGFTHLQGRFFVPALPLLALAITASWKSARSVPASHAETIGDSERQNRSRSKKHRSSSEPPESPADNSGHLFRGGPQGQVSPPQNLFPTALLVLASLLVPAGALLGWYNVHSRLGPILAGLVDDRGRDARGEILTGDNLDWLSLATMDGFPVDDPDVALLLVGDGKAFWQRTPMTRLRYRTPFDLPGGPETSVVDAYGKPGPKDWALIDPAEIKRFHRTYQPFPGIPDELGRSPAWQGESPPPYVVRPGQTTGQGDR